MSKSKSVVLTTLLTIVIVALCLMCVVPEFGLPFRVNGAYQKYNSVVSVINYGSDLGGGYSAVYYPEGVISAEEYDAKLDRLTVSLADELKKGGVSVTEEADYAALKAAYESRKDAGSDIVAAGKVVAQADEFIGKYKGWNGKEVVENGKDAVLYLELEKVCYAKGDSYVVDEDFDSDFDDTVEAISRRFDKKNFSFLSVAKVNGYAIRVNVPSTVSDPDTLFAQMGYTGEFTLRGADSTRPVLQGFGEHKMSEYFKSASASSNGATGYVRLKLTSAGKDKIYDITKAIADGDSDDKTLYFYVGEEQLIGLSLSEAIDQRTLFISGESMTAESAENIGIVIDSCINDRVVDLTLSAGTSISYEVGSGKTGTIAIYIVFGAALLALAIYSIVRYKGLGVTQLFAALSFLICMVMYIAFLPGMLLHTSGVFAVALTGVLLVLSNFYIFEKVRKEFNTGKTLEASVKAGYKKSLAAVLDAHILLFIIGLILYFTSVSEVVTFAFIFTLGVLTSGILSLLVTRFYWFIMRGLLPRARQYKFSGFVREVTDDDED